MRAVLVGVAVAVLVAVVGGPADGRQPEKIDAKLLVGKWTPKEAAKSGDFVIEFFKDGKLKLEAGDGKAFKAEGTYKLDGDKLTLKMKMGEKEKTQVRTVYSLTRTELVSADEGGSKDTLLRVPAKGDK
ncbi:MAG TPA: TIGR03066 family protein [Urbifossiella sp.]|nr:TIGR03066 family protein [Urbifossiella sp.]